ncbi:MAG TPA: cytochrome c [Bacillus bacterium]|nr:cytochrome c [Bacillus sp. (in: firmicutes)]
MNFPVVEFPWLGNGMVIAIIATIHVLISHGVAVGATALTVSLEHKAYKTNNKKLDDVARMLTKWILIVTTTAGAMTGVGIWFTTTVIEPASIGSMLRIFFWAWFVEWIVFCTEVILIIIYYYTWDKWKDAKKQLHLRIGYALAVASWLTMAIIVGILAAKLTPGLWVETLSFWNAFFNPTYLPSLLFRTFVAIVLATSFITLIVKFKIKNQELQGDIFSVFSKIMLISLPALLIFGSWYLSRIPKQAYDQIVWSTGMSNNMFTTINIVGLAILIIYTIWAFMKPKKVSTILGIAVWIACIGYIGEFEMVRESVRKPFIIYDYMYANGVLAKNVEMYKTEGYLPQMSFLGVDEVTEENKYEAGEALYKGQCMACHTIDGWRTKRAFSQRVAGWPEDTLASYISTLHETRPFMPPFVGTDKELEALAHYIATSANNKEVQRVAKGE